MKVFKVPKVSKGLSGLGYKKILTPIGLALFLFAGVFGVLKFNDIFYSTSETNTDTSWASQQSESDKQPQPTKDEVAEDSTDKEEEQTPETPVVATPSPTIDSTSYLLVVNKRNPLASNYRPADLRQPNVAVKSPGNDNSKLRADAATATESLFVAATAQGCSPLVSSAFRSYNLQSSLYTGYVNSMGQAEADRISARPGYSEHQSGLVLDICNRNNCQLETTFASTPLGQWIKNNAHLHGFIIRYQEGKEPITGYSYEPWHLRYVGVQVATEIYNANTTLEEYLGLPPAPDYN